ncbi:MAG: hypothetical protein ACI4OT_02330 [Bacilli bacterium]
MNIEDKTFIHINSLIRYYKYICSELDKKGLLDKYRFYFDCNIDDIKRDVLDNNDKFRLDVDRDFIYLRNIKSFNKLLIENAIDDVIKEIIIEKSLKNEELLNNTCNILGMEFYKTTEEKLKKGLFIELDENNNLVIDKNHSKDYYIAKKQIESWPKWKQECARDFMTQFKIENEESNSVKDTQPILRKRYKIVGRKLNNKK